MIDAAQAAILVAAEHHRRAAMRAGVGDQSDTSLRIAERHEIFAQQHHALRLSVRHQILREHERDPVQPEKRSHRRSGADTNQCLIVLV